jgi:HK97 family phage major capsid protein
MDAKLKELQEQKNAKAAAIKELAARQDKWTAEDRTAWDAVNKEYDETAAALKTRDEELKSSAAVQARLKQIEDDQRAATGDRAIGLDGDKRREAEPERIRGREFERRALAMQSWAMSSCNVDLRDEHRAACRDLNFNPTAKEILLAPDGAIHRAAIGSDGCDLPIGSARLRYGDHAWSTGDGARQAQREVRVGLDVATAGAGIETIPEGFMYALEKKTLAYGSVRQVAKHVQTATGNSLPWPVVSDTGNVAAILAEATTIGTSVDPTFSAITLLAYKLSSKPVFVSNEILQDSAFNLASELAELIGIRFGRGENVYFTTGTNSSQPQGVVVAAGTGVTSAAAAAFTADELIALVHSLDPSYRALPSTGFMMKDDVVSYVRKFKDANGQNLWQPGMQLGVPDRLYGFPVIVNQQMTGLTSGVPVTATKHVLFGAFEKYLVRDAGGVRMYHLTERYRDVDQDCFVAFKRIDGRALNADAFKVLLQA